MILESLGHEDARVVDVSDDILAVTLRGASSSLRVIGDEVGDAFATDGTIGGLLERIRILGPEGARLATVDVTDGFSDVLLAAPFETAVPATSTT